MVTLPTRQDTHSPQIDSHRLVAQGYNGDYNRCCHFVYRTQYRDVALLERKCHIGVRRGCVDIVQCVDYEKNKTMHF